MEDREPTIFESIRGVMDVARGSMNPDDFSELERLLTVLENHLRTSPKYDKPE